MQHKTFTVNATKGKQAIENFVRHYYQQAYESRYSGGFIRVYEDYSLLNENQLMVCLRVDSSKENEVIIEMIVGGASSSLLFGAWDGSESRRIEHFEERLKGFCKIMEEAGE